MNEIYLRGLLGALLLASMPSLAALDFHGQVGRLDEAQLDEDWYLLGPGEFPILPLEGVTVTVLDCDTDCPDPVTTDPAGWYTVPDLVSPARLRLDPPACDPADIECEPLEPREVLLDSGARTALGAKWPTGTEDTMLRYMPSVAGTLYVRHKGEIPGRPGASGSAATWMIWIDIDGLNFSTFLETRIFLHELMHVYEYRLRLNCWEPHGEVDGWVLQKDWLRVHDEDRRRLERLGLPLRERDGYELSEDYRSRETLARFAAKYFMPEASTIQWLRERPYSTIQTYRELEDYAPNRYAWFERLVFARYLDRETWERANPDAAEDWPGTCEPFPPSLGWALDRLPPLPGSSKSTPLSPPVKCGTLELP